MTERMGDEQLDREIRGFLAWQAEDVAGAPSATEMATRISDRAGTATARLRVAPQLAWVLLAGLLVLALLGALAVGANRPPPAPPLPVAYEAVFLRTEVVGDSHTVVVVGVNDEGRERQIARLPGAWAAHDIGTNEVVYDSPQGAVSPSGLLAIPSDRGDRPLWVHWEIFDLHQPQNEPFVVPGVRHDIEAHFDAFWGPGERLAIRWFDDEAGCSPNWPPIVTCLAFVEGRTGASTTMIVPENVLPSWAVDGSGVFVGEDPNDPGRVLRPRVLRPDGTVVEAPLVDAVPSCRTRAASGADLVIEERGPSSADGASLVRLFPDGRREVLASSDYFEGACLAPDDSAIFYDWKLIDPHSGATFRTKGNLAGWLEVPR